MSEPRKVPFLDLRAQYRTIADELDEAIAGVVESQHFILGPRVEAFEEAIAARVGVDHAVGCASGTDSLLLTLMALDLPDGADVVVPAFTFFATAGAVWNAGYRPVFADIDPASFNVTAATIEAALTEETGAVIVVHLFGQMAPMADILDLAASVGIPVIEDAAQAIDARRVIDGSPRAAGSLGAAGCFSFFPTKNLGAFGDAGMVTTSDPALAERLRKLRVHGGRQMYHHEMVGTNSRIDALQAAVLHAKLDHLDRWTRGRQRNADFYDRSLASMPGVATPAVDPGNRHVYNQYTIRVDGREALRARLEEAGVGSNVYYPLPLHLQECFATLGYRQGDLPASESAASEVLSLPIYPELTDEQRLRVVDGIRAAREA